jgi:Uma2 family endonuclease
VADSSLRFDRITKARLYARHGIADYWIVNVVDEAVEVHRDPSGDGWGSRTVHRAGEVLRPLLLPHVTIELDPLLDFTAARVP